jgi:hypothetical protein
VASGFEHATMARRQPKFLETLPLSPADQPTTDHERGGAEDRGEKPHRV